MKPFRISEAILFLKYQTRDELTLFCIFERIYTLSCILSFESNIFSVSLESCSNTPIFLSLSPPVIRIVATVVAGAEQGWWRMYRKAGELNTSSKSREIKTAPLTNFKSSGGCPLGMRTKCLSILMTVSNELEPLNLTVFSE